MTIEGFLKDGAGSFIENAEASAGYISKILSGEASPTGAQQQD